MIIKQGEICGIHRNVNKAYILLSYKSKERYEMDMRKYNPWSGLMFVLRKIGTRFPFIQQYWYVSGLEGQDFVKRLPKMMRMCLNYTYRKLIGKIDIYNGQRNSDKKIVV